MDLKELAEKLAPGMVDELAPALWAKIEPSITMLLEAEKTAREANDTEALAGISKTQEEFAAALEEMKATIPEKRIPSQEEIEDNAEHNPLHKGKFKSLNHFLTDMVKEAGNNLTAEMADWRQVVADSGKKGMGNIKATQTVGSMEAGGALMPEGFSTEVYERLIVESPIMRQAQIIPMQELILNIPYIAGFDESQGFYFGNVKWYWTGEGATKTSTNFETGTVTLQLNELTGMVTATDLLLKHSPTSVKAIIDRAFSRGMAQAITRACIRGTGAGMPQGVFNAVCEIERAKETGQAADVITTRNLYDMLARLYSPDGRVGEGTWYANKTTMPTLGELTIGVGTGGTALFLDRIQDPAVWRLLGMEIEFNTMMSAVGDNGDIGLFDWSQYMIGQWGSGGVEEDMSIHLYFDTNKTAFRFVTLFDGRCWWPETFKPEYGDPQSPFVTLAERA